MALLVTEQVLVGGALRVGPPACYHPASPSRLGGENVVERRKSLVVRTVGRVAVVYFVDTKLLEEMQIKWLGNEMYDLVAGGKCNVLINFENVQRFSTALLGKLVGLKRKAVEAGGTVKLCCIPPHILEIFNVTGLDNAFDIYGDEVEAISSFGRI
jgi:anti-sigma B factor antagonist